MKQRDEYIRLCDGDRVINGVEFEILEFLKVVRK